MSDDLKIILAKLEEMEASKTKLVLDSVLEALSTVRAELDNTRKQLVYSMQDNLALSQRISKLEDRWRQE